MKKTTAYKTKQRDYVLECISRGGTMNADEIVELLRVQGNPVGKSTVYRYLNVLVEEGLCRRFESGGGSACYQYAPNECRGHFHLKCGACGELFHLESPVLDRLAKEVHTQTGFELDDAKTILYGICKDCKNK